MNKITAKLREIDVLLLDVDGVLTQGEIILDANGSELKVFNVKDGLGLRLLMNSGVMVGVVTGRSSPALMHRCNELGIMHIYHGIKDKASVVETITKEIGLAPSTMAFMGDDLPDLRLMCRVGMSIAVADAHPEVRARADWITAAKGGCGAVREACEMILKSKGKWETALNSYV